jgi:gamma-glutamyltranspeptidase/glutathione hydrolase
LARYGTLKLEHLLRPAIKHARNGVPVSLTLNSVIEAVGLGSGPHTVALADGFAVDSRLGNLFMPGGRPLAPGALLVQEGLAATLETIALGGPAMFYRGPIAEQIVDACAAAGAHITRSDLAAVGAEWKPSLQNSYRGWEVHTTPWRTAGAQLLGTLGLLDGFDLAALGLDSADCLHLLIESIKRAQADRVAHLGEVDFDPRPLLTAERAAERRVGIDRSRASRSVGDEWLAEKSEEVPAAVSDTTQFVVADALGNLVSVTQTIGSHFGSKALVGDTGILLNNLTKFPRSGLPMAPGIVFAASGQPSIAVGSVGGPGIPQTITQILAHVIDFGLDPQTALEAPRLRVFKDYRVMIESRISKSARAQLERRGHKLDVVGEWAFGEGQLGRGQMITRDDSGTLFAASDPRAGGAAQAI